MKRLIGVAVLTALCVAAEPLKTDDAQKKLEEKAEQREAEANAPATKAEVDRLRRQVAALLDDVARLRKEVRELQDARQVHPAEGGTEELAVSPADVKKAIREKRVIVGMTLADVRQSLEQPKDGGILLREQEGGYQDYEFTTPTLGTKVYVTFRQGHVVRYTNEVLRLHPAPGGSSNPFNRVR